MPKSKLSPTEAFKVALAPTAAFTTPAEWVAWSQARPDSEPEMTISVFERGHSQFHGDVTMIAEMARLKAQFLRITEDSYEAEDARRVALAYFSIAYQKDRSYRANFVEAVRFHCDIGDYKAAEKMYGNMFGSLRRVDGSLSAYHSEKLGDIYNALDRYDLARACYGMALRAEDRDPKKTLTACLNDKLTLMEMASNAEFSPADWALVTTAMRQLRVGPTLASHGRSIGLDQFPENATGVFDPPQVHVEIHKPSAHSDETLYGGYNADGHDLE